MATANRAVSAGAVSAESSAPRYASAKTRHCGTPRMDLSRAKQCGGGGVVLAGFRVMPHQPTE
jgi:hypothetical protein